MISDSTSREMKSNVDDTSILAPSRDQESEERQRKERRSRDNRDGSRRRGKSRSRKDSKSRRYYSDDDSEISSQDSSIERRRRKKRKKKKSRKEERRSRRRERDQRKRRKKKRHDSSSSSSYTSDDSSSSSSSSDRKRRKKRKRKKEQKTRTNEDKNIVEDQSVPDEVLQRKASTVASAKPVAPEAPSTNSEPKRKAMVPMSREEYEKEQSKIREVYDPLSGRVRLVRGSGEIIERIVSSTTHRQINSQATSGDGYAFSRGIYNRLKK